MVETSDRLHISRIWARNFRSLRDFELDLAPITVLVGRNGSGKSNIIDVLKFISEAFYEGVQTAVSYRNGPRSILHISEGKQANEFSVGLETVSNTITAEYQLTVRSESRDRVRVPEERITLRIAGKERRIVVRDGTFVEPKLGRPIRGVLRQLSRKQGAKAVFTPMLSLIGDQPSFAATVTAWLFSDEDSEGIIDIASAVSDLTGLLGEMRFYRIFPDNIRQPQPVSLKDSLEEEGANLASVLRFLKSRHLDSYERVKLALQRIAPDIIDIQPKIIGGTQFIRLVHSSPSNPDKKWSLDIAQESDGIARALALLVAVEQKPAPAMLAMEEPELGIHTAALSVIAESLTGASSGPQVLVSTHSSDFLDFVPVDAIRAVDSIEGATVAGIIADHQKAVIRDQLMTPGYVHRVEGLELHRRSSRQWRPNND